MNHRIENLIKGISSGIEIVSNKQIEALDIDIFNTTLPFKMQLKNLETFVIEHIDYEPVIDLLIDVLMFQYFSVGISENGDEFFDSPEWASIEDNTIGKGSEMLNILLYLQECLDNEIKPGLEDYIEEYIFADEEFEQDEFQLYEPIVKNMESLVSEEKAIAYEICKLYENSNLGSEMMPIVAFFMSDGKTSEADGIISNGDIPIFQVPFLKGLEQFWFTKNS